MDNLTHTLCGLALARLGLDRHGPRATLALAVGANLPDVDIVTGLVGLETYLVHHRGITHSLVGVVAQTVLLALAVRHWPARSAGDRAPLSILAWYSLLGVGSHLALDALNSYGVRPFLPFDPGWIYGDAVFIVEPWLWLAFGAAAVSGARRSLPSDVAWLVLVAAASALMAWSGRMPVPFLAAWTVAMGFVLWVRMRGLSPAGRRLGARAGVACALLYVGAAFVTTAAARARAVAAVEAVLPDGARLDATSITPLPAMPWRHECLVVQDGHVRRVRVDLLAGEVVLGNPIAQNLDDPILERVRMTQRLRAWRTFARVPYVTRSQAGEVVLGDLRYGHEPERRDWSSLRVEVE